MSETAPEHNRERQQDSAHWTLIRDAAVLQFKLIVDGLRDLLLVPASLLAAVASLATASNGRPGPQFYQLLQLGKQSEIWINLFGAYKHAPDDIREDDLFADMNIDEIIGRVEGYVVEEYHNGGMTAQAKDQIDKALNAIQRRRKKNQPGADAGDASQP